MLESKIPLQLRRPFVNFRQLVYKSGVFYKLGTYATSLTLECHPLKISQTAGIDQN